MVHYTLSYLVDFTVILTILYAIYAIYLLCEFYRINMSRKRVPLQTEAPGVERLIPIWYMKYWLTLLSQFLSLAQGIVDSKIIKYNLE